MKLTKEDFAYLQSFDYQFYTATQSNYSAALRTSDVERMREIYSRCIDKDYKINGSCGSCVLRLLKKLSVYYYEYKNQLKEETDGTERKTNQNETEGNLEGQNDTETVHPKRTVKRKK